MTVETRRPRVGAAAPRFALSADDGGQVSSDSLAGKRYALYFYPKDDTPGCTTQACGLRDAWPRITEARIEVFGVSPDSVASHRRFRDKYRLPFRLLSDEGHRLAEQYGVWVEKQFAGRRYMAVERSTYVIGPDGRVEAVLVGVKPDQHVELLLGAVAR